MRQLTLAALLLTFLAAPAAAVMSRVDVTYTNGQILSGPLSADLDTLPASVQASFTLLGPASGELGLGDVAEASLSFGDAAWSAADLQSFAVTFFAIDGFLSITDLTYAFGPRSTALVEDRLATNFPLEITGTDIATGEAFHYRYDSSTQSVTPLEPGVPEPATAGLALLALWGVALAASRRRA